MAATKKAKAAVGITNGFLVQFIANSLRGHYVSNQYRGKHPANPQMLFLRKDEC